MLKQYQLGVIAAMFAGHALAVTAPAADNATDEPTADVCVQLLKDARELVAGDSFSSLGFELRWQVYATLVNCGVQLNRTVEIDQGIAGLLSLDPDNAEVHLLRVRRASEGDQPPAAGVQSLERLAATAPESISAIELRTLFAFIRELDGERSSLGRTYRALFGADYRSPDVLDSLDGLRLEYARLLAEDGDAAGASAQLALISDPSTAADFYFDARFKILESVQRVSQRTELEALVVRYKAASKSRAEEHPDRLRASHAYIQALRLAGDFAEAERVSLRWADAARAPGAEAIFTDLDEFAPWVLNERAYALYDLGRNDEAREILSEASKLKEFGTPNVSQTINFAESLIGEGRFDDALNEIARLEGAQASPYGDMWAAYVRVCARSFTGGMNADDPDLKFVRENEETNDAAFARTMLCLNDLDAYSAHLKRRLADPDRRADALRTLQRHPLAPSVLPIDAEIERRRNSVIERADVQAAIDEVGKVIDLPFHPIYWGSY